MDAKFSALHEHQCRRGYQRDRATVHEDIQGELHADKGHRSAPLRAELISVRPLLRASKTCYVSRQ